VEELEDMDEKAKKSLKNSSIHLYNNDKNITINRGVDFEQKRQKNVEKITESVDKSIAKLKKDHPSLDDKQITIVKQKLLGNYMYDLYNNDGTVKEDAGSKVALSLFANETINEMKSAFEKIFKQDVNKAVSKERENATLHLNDKVKVQSSDIEKESVMKKELERRTKHLKENNLFINKNK
jgi:cell division protein ZapA (FtsZ GTPase activity inhibitor)